MNKVLNEQEKEFLYNSIRSVDNFPKEGIVFKDITTLLNNKEAFKLLMNHLEERYKSYDLDYIAGVDSRGFIFGSILADRLGIGFVPIRKKGKLPFETLCGRYELEYGFDEIEVHKDAFNNEEKPKVLLMDDIIVSGGTAVCASNLIIDLNAQLVEACFILSLEFLEGAKKVEKITPVYSVLSV